jgi:hypothetical protein
MPPLCDRTVKLLPSTRLCQREGRRLSLALLLSLPPLVHLLQELLAGSPGCFRQRHGCHRRRRLGFGAQRLDVLCRQKQAPHVLRLQAVGLGFGAASVACIGGEKQAAAAATQQRGSQLVHRRQLGCRQQVLSCTHE